MEIALTTVLALPVLSIDIGFHGEQVAIMGGLGICSHEESKLSWMYVLEPHLIFSSIKNELCSRHRTLYQILCNFFSPYTSSRKDTIETTLLLLSSRWCSTSPGSTTAAEPSTATTSSPPSSSV
jgi:hypothetical protein